MRVRVVPSSGLLLVAIVVILIAVHTLGPALAVPPGGPFPAGSFQIQGADGTCLGVAPGSRARPPYWIGSVALSECSQVPEQTWRYDRARHHVLITARLNGPCADQGLQGLLIARCWSALDGLRAMDEQWSLTADGAITGGDLPSWGEVVSGVPKRGCWEATDVAVLVTACRDYGRQRWRVVPVP